MLQGLSCHVESELQLVVPRQLPAPPQILSEDYSKAVFLCRDRSLQFHAKFGAYHSTRIPRFGRDMAYAPFNADLLIVGSAPEVYRCGPQLGLPVVFSGSNSRLHCCLCLGLAGQGPPQVAPRRPNFEQVFR